MKQKKAKMSLEKKHNLTGWAFLIPAALLIFIFCFYPMIQAIILSFTKKGSGFAGLANYQRILKDKTFQQCLFNTVFYFIIQVPIMLLLALGLAHRLYFQYSYLSYMRDIPCVLFHDFQILICPGRSGK